LSADWRTFVLPSSVFCSGGRAPRGHDRGTEPIAALAADLLGLIALRMTLTAAVWVLLAAYLLLQSFRRPASAVALYMLTFFAAPHLWWWGRSLPTLRYALWSGVILLGAVVLHRLGSMESGDRRFGLVHAAAVAMAVNATFVNFMLASHPPTSTESLIELLKFVTLFFLMSSAIRNRGDFQLVMLAITIGAFYIGYEVTINDRGSFLGSRLEGVGAPGANTSNSLACLMLVVLPLMGSLFVAGSRLQKAIVVLSGPFALNVLLLCNSRGAFLGLAGAGLSFLLVSRGATRKQAIRALALGGIALFLLLGDPRILDRFTTTFVGSEDRDNSAASRIEFWKAGLLMLRDYPLGAGGSSFKNVHGGRYLARVISAEDADDRSLHNGYITEATDWGIQGLLLKLLFFGAAVAMAYRTSNRCRLDGRLSDSLVGVCVIGAMGGFLVHSLFGAFFSNEWAYWITALLVRYSEIYRLDQATAVPEISAARTAAAA
jgi:putative inorganic carbon (hco3(-)) transporter